jgi:hypothetical protein
MRIHTQGVTATRPPLSESAAASSGQACTCTTILPRARPALLASNAATVCSNEKTLSSTGLTEPPSIIDAMVASAGPSPKQVNRR